MLIYTLPGQRLTCLYRQKEVSARQSPTSSSRLSIWIAQVLVLEWLLDTLLVFEGQLWSSFVPLRTKMPQSDRFAHDAVYDWEDLHSGTEMSIEASTAEA